MSELSQIFVVKQQRGPTLKLTITLVTVAGENIKPHKYIITDTIQVGDNVLVYFKFKLHESKKDNMIYPYVGVRQKIPNPYQHQQPQKPQKCTDEIIITCDRFNKTLSCADVWLEGPMCPKKYDSIKTCGKGSFEISSLMYIFNVDVTVKAESPKPLLINSKLYEDTEFTDFQLHAPDGAVAFHKTMLSLHSDTFKTMLKGEWKISEGHININGVTVQTLQNLKDYIYLGTLPDEGLESLLLVAGYYSMEKLKSDCIAKLVNSVKAENYEKLVEFACQGSGFVDLVRALIFEVPDSTIDRACFLRKLRLKSDSLEEKNAINPL